MTDSDRDKFIEQIARGMTHSSWWKNTALFVTGMLVSGGVAFGTTWYTYVREAVTAQDVRAMIAVESPYVPDKGVISTQLSDIKYQIADLKGQVAELQKTLDAKSASK